MRLALSFLALLVFALAALSFPQGNSNRKISCKTTGNAASCQWIHGRLQFYNGTPSFRLWKIGTRRLLGIYSGSSAQRADLLDNEHPELPRNVQEKFVPAANRVFADFEICPLEPEKLGSMQAACIEAAKNIFIENLSVNMRR